MAVGVTHVQPAIIIRITNIGSNNPFIFSPPSNILLHIVALLAGSVKDYVYLFRRNRLSVATIPVSKAALSISGKYELALAILAGSTFIPG